MLFNAADFLYIHDSELDVYLKILRRAVQSIPDGVLQSEVGCHPIITRFVQGAVGNAGIYLGHGFHFSDNSLRKNQGLAFCLNPPYTDKIEKVEIHQALQLDRGFMDCSSFTVGENRFLLTPDRFNLDEVACGYLSTGEIYGKSERNKLSLASLAR